MRDPIWNATLIGCTGFLVLFVTQILWYRLSPPANRLTAFNRLFILFVVPQVAAAFWLIPKLDFSQKPSLGSSYFLIFFIILSVFFGCLAFYAGIEHSVRLRVSVELFMKKGKPIYYEELFTIYSPEDATRRRLQQLEKGGYIKSTNKGYVLTSKGLFFAKIADFGKRFFKIGLGG